MRNRKRFSIQDQHVCSSMLLLCSSSPSIIISYSWHLLAGRCGRLSKTDRWLMCWWAFTGLTHIIIEGTFVFTPHFFKKGSPTYFNEVCKFSLSAVIIARNQNLLRVR